MTNTKSPTLTPVRPKSTRVRRGTVRGRAALSGEGDGGDDGSPKKRPRKALNCEPCRVNRRRCDRKHPCSSCTENGETSLCFEGSMADESGNISIDTVNTLDLPFDPIREIAQLRTSINLLEAHVTSNASIRLTSPSKLHRQAVAVSKREVNDEDEVKHLAGILGDTLYAGPTSAVVHLIRSEDTSREGSESRTDRSESVPLSHEFTRDSDLLSELPPLEIIDELVNFYFEYCNWIYRHVNEVAFRNHWHKFKNGRADRLVLATVTNIMAVAAHYLPSDNPLLVGYSGSQEEVGMIFFNISRSALQRHQEDTKAYSLELVELLLIRGHYLTLSKTDTEDIWRVKGELIVIATALGLHRDPGRWKMNQAVAERRRWAWWHIILLERWQSFLFGRPISIAGHHFDTEIPSYCDPAVDPTGRLYLPNVALFKLAAVLGDILDCAVSVLPVPYSSIQANDRALTNWMDNLPSDLALDEYGVARNLGSANTSIRRLGVQSVIIRTSYYHIRFTLHRPYAVVSDSPSPSDAGSVPVPPETAKSLEIAVAAADSLITMVGLSRPDFLANSALAVPGHMNWGPFHCFTAAMFFSFQLIANPDQLGANLFRSSIRKAIVTLEQARGSAVADKALLILQTLEPLYSVQVSHETEQTRKAKRAQILSTVRRLAFPYHDSKKPRGRHPVPPNNITIIDVNEHLNPPRTAFEHQEIYQPTPISHEHIQAMAALPQYELTPILCSRPTFDNQMPGPPVSMSTFDSPQLSWPFAEDPLFSPLFDPSDDATIWGASMGIGEKEWTQFMTGFGSGELLDTAR